MKKFFKNHPDAALVVSALIITAVGAGYFIVGIDIIASALRKATQLPSETTGGALFNIEEADKLLGEQTSSVSGGGETSKPNSAQEDLSSPENTNAPVNGSKNFLSE